MLKRCHNLRSCRRRAFLSQRDVAFLLGVRSISKISRYERNVALPPVRTALAYQAIFGRPLAYLFREYYAAIEIEVRRRAGSLVSRSYRSRRPILNLRRKESLQAIAKR